MDVDSFADLIPVAVVLGYLFLKFAGRSQRPEAPTAPRRTVRPAGRGTAGPTPFEQLLARLDEANGTTTTVQPPPLEPPPVQPRRPESPLFTESRKAVADYEARTAAATAFRTVDAGRGFDAEARGFEHERHGFGPQNPLSELAFQAARNADRRVANANSQAYDPHGLRTAPRSVPGPSIAARLAEPGALRDAFVLQTILARRPAPRRPR